MITRPRLSEIPLHAVLPLRQGECYATVGTRQWDATLQAAYDLGFILLELDDNERIVRAFKTTDLN